MIEAVRSYVWGQSAPSAQPDPAEAVRVLRKELEEERMRAASLQARVSRLELEKDRIRFPLQSQIDRLTEERNALREKNRELKRAKRELAEKVERQETEIDCLRNNVGGERRMQLSYVDKATIFAATLLGIINCITRPEDGLTIYSPTSRIVAVSNRPKSHS